MEGPKYQIDPTTHLDSLASGVHLFGQALAKALSLLMLEGESCLLQYGRDLLIYSPDKLTSLVAQW